MADSRKINFCVRVTELVQTCSEMPTDVTFKIEEDVNKEDKVKAHRLVMGMASEPFRKMLFVTDTEDKESKEINVSETTVAAFRAMVDAIYDTKPIAESLKEKTVCEMFDVLNLLKKYQIPELVLAATDCLANFPLTEEVVLEVAGEAMKYRDCFEEEAKLLLLHCAKFLQPKFKDVKSVFEFSEVKKEHGEILVELFALMNSITPEKCKNCNNAPCKAGEEVKEEEFYIGLMVAWNKLGYFGRQSEWEGDWGTVGSTRQGNVTVKDRKSGKINTGEYYKERNGIKSFLFKC